MRFPIWLSLMTALVVVTGVVLAGSFIIQPDRPLIVSANLSPDVISPDADGMDDITQISYEISRSALVSIIFEAEDGTQYLFRDGERRSSNEYSVLFSGVVDGFTLPAEPQIEGDIMRRLLPDGNYTWRLQAVAQDDGEQAEATGTLTISGADPQLPQLLEFTVSPQVFTPNQDGVNDRVMINLYVDKEAELDVYLLDADERRLPIARREEGRSVGEAGRHVYDYEGGVDIGADPPEDGTYRVVAEARDAEGQITRRTAELSIEAGGKPRAEIVAQPVGATVVFDVLPYDASHFSSTEGAGELIPPPDDPSAFSLLPVTMPVGDILVFKLTVENYGTAPIRTIGPFPGTVYEQTQLTSSLGEYEQSGAWRVGIQCETSEQSYPWRWAIGSEADLYTEVDPTNGNVYYYLPPGARAVVWGGIRMTELIETANPQACWAGLIHEDVEITVQNSNVGRREVELADLTPDDDN